MAANRDARWFLGSDRYLQATDASGYTGLSDQVDYHTWTLLKGMALSTLLVVGTETTFGSSQNNLVPSHVHGLPLWPFDNLGLVKLARA